MGVMSPNEAEGVGLEMRGFCLSFFAWSVPSEGKKGGVLDLVR